MATNAEKLKALIEQREQLDAKIKEARNAARRDERKARNHALMVAGGIIMKHAPGGDWKRLDWDRFAAWVDQYGFKIEQCEADELPPDEAYKRLREWERGGKRSGGEDDAADSAGSSSAPGGAHAAEDAYTAENAYGVADAAATGGAYAAGDAYGAAGAVEPDGLRWPDPYGGAAWGAGALDGDRI